MFIAASLILILIGAICIWNTISINDSAKRDAEELRKSILETALDGIITINDQNFVEEWNESAEKIFGFSRNEMIGKDLSVIIPPDKRVSHLSGMQRYMLTGESKILRKRIEVDAIKKDGSIIRIELAVSPFHFRGELYFTARTRDITEENKYKDQREILIAELNHRVKNTLAIVQSFANQAFRSTQTADEANKIFMDRIMSLSRSHNILTREGWEGADLKEIVEISLSPFKEENWQRIFINGPKVRLSISSSLSVAMSLHELATNAAKYGALSNTAGEIHIDWCHDDDKITIVWLEINGPVVTIPTRKGFGTRLIEREFVSDGGSAEFTYDPHGISCVIRFPCKNEELC